MKLFSLLIRITVTLAVTLGAVGGGWWLWDYYMNEPWTRDGRVRADVVQVSSDVAGLVTEVRVFDNQAVRKGDVLFVVDPSRYRLAVEQAEANLESARAELSFRKAEADRYAQLGNNVVSTAQRQEVASAQAKAAAAARQMEAALDLARFNLERTEVRATVDGFVTNLQLKAGNYVTAGQPVVAVIDRHSFYVVGYFEETKLPRIRVGDPVRVTIMGEPERLTGRVDSVTHAIVDRDRTEGTGLLPNVNPTFNWVRLAQRIPVRVALEQVPDPRDLVAGRTVTVEVVRESEQGAPAKRVAGQ
ncbi:efflux transporter periplasmic adaptor subunit (plasmid) [Azospirillum sp. TSH58]|uniref:efflux RND transporter periplasmic adaptor subunit n=1 Tax=Azospirillum sp. TSH58 TaxID=664962 RepID=UPI000D6011B6|nr:HlyD family secretion protein [Azospirillum sp. TSH58]AWJ86642.1 efflux transporter periplasmic adaptor subunit [Azospirillum sp. TSH58]PWC61727.1 secretion protein HlyD [Azospirillum sp. TSH58]